MEILKPTLRLKTCTLWLALALLCQPPAASAQETDRYHKVEAAFLYNFFNYITWPDYNSPQDMRTANICIFDDDPIKPYLQYVQQKMTSERTLNIQSVNDAAAISKCNLLFTRHRLADDVLKEIPGSTLIVTEPLDSLDRGQGMIELDRDGQGILMHIDQPQLAENGFQVSSRLLALAMK